MKKNIFALIIILYAINSKCFAQTLTSDFYAGKWEISILGSPRGDVIFETILTRKDGKLTGELSNKLDPNDAIRPIIKVEESETKLLIYFEASQVGEIAIDLSKVDNNTLKGTIMSYEATAIRRGN